jgi:hypothetical protein
VESARSSWIYAEGTGKAGTSLISRGEAQVEILVR